jgi:tRNA threonylcarbamoyladenosine modification (KEOPS) complex Cgi121 subunit
LLLYLREYTKYLEITGYRNVLFQQAEEFLKLNRKQTKHDAEIQFFNADTIATWQHLNFAAINALAAFKGKTNISKSLAVEIMLYASAQRQIKKAILQVGIKKDYPNIAAIIISDDVSAVKAALKLVSEGLDAKPDESVLELNAQKQATIKKTFQITDREAQTVTAQNSKEATVNLIIEHMALLSTQL